LIKIELNLGLTYYELRTALDLICILTSQLSNFASKQLSALLPSPAYSVTLI